MKKVIVVILCILMSSPLAAFAAVQTQVNEVTDLFDKHIENKNELLQNMKKQNDNVLEQIKSRVHHDSIEGIDGAEAKVQELNSINETALDDAGRQKRNSKEYQFYDENELEPDYSKSGNRLHKLDSDDIVKATEKTMRDLGIDLMKRLIELGFNCKTVKGAIHKEPTYYIEIKREDQENTEYDQYFCEEPRNQYNCNDNLTLYCKVQGMKWGEWQSKQLDVDGGELIKFSAQRHMFNIDHVASKCFEYKLFSTDSKPMELFKKKCDPNPSTIPHMREFLAARHKATIDNIGMEMSFSWYGGIFSIDGWTYAGRVLGSKDYAWAHYIINYKYRDGNPACFEWHEDWNESCGLK